MHSLRTASFCHETSTYYFKAFACYSFASHWVRTTIYAIPCTLSYCTWSSHASISRCCMLGSSYNEVRTTKDSSNIVVQFCTVYPISSNPFLIVPKHYSLTSEGIEHYAFNHSSEIWRLRSSCTLVASSFASWNLVANRWIRSTIGRSTATTNSRTFLQALSTTFSSPWVYPTSSSHCWLSSSILIFCSLNTCSVQPSLVRSLAMIPSCN